MISNYFNNLKFLVSIFVSGLIVFFLFRILLLLTQCGQVTEIPDKGSILFQSFLIGLRFDTVISCYILALPLAILSLTASFNYYAGWLYKFAAGYMCLFYVLAFCICMADIPYYSFFYKHINASIFNWAGEQSFVAGMILKDKQFLIYVLAGILVCVGFCIFIFKIIVRKFSRNFPVKEKYNWKKFIIILICFLVSGGLCFLGIRGRVAIKSPIRIGTAYFCNYPFANQLGLNPVFYFLHSVLDAQKMQKQEIYLMPDDDAVANTCKYLGIDKPESQFPIARKENENKEVKKYNVVLILMESLAADLLQRNSGESDLPFLDSLSNNCLFFENAYSAGIHTMNGVCAGLFSYPSLMQQHPFKSEMKIMHGFPNILKANGYQTIYFTTHDEQFDNIGGFVLANDIERVVSEKDYPSNMVLSNLGVPDDYMFETAIPILNEMSAKDKPFFAAMLTASNHTPFVIPDYFSPKPGDIKKQMLEYSDWALEKFFRLAKKEGWYENTIFVLCADHGAPVGPQIYDMSLSFNHVPILIISPEVKEPAVYSAPSGQIDIFPTVMGMLGIPYVNYTFGENLLEKERQYIFFSADNLIGCISNDYFYVYNMDGKESLYDYRTKSPENLIELHKTEAESMRKYAFSMIQTAQYLWKKY